MRVLILRLTDQPATNICKNIARYSKHDCVVGHRDTNLNTCYNDYDLIFYYNINDLVYDNRRQLYNMLQKSRYKICTGIQSHRVLDFSLMGRVRDLKAIVGICTPKASTMDEIKEAIDHKDLVYTVTPFSADQELFRPEQEISTSGKLRVGYVGSDTPNKRFNDVIKPVLNILKDEVEPHLYGRVGKRVAHGDMCKEYNKMDCLVVSSHRPQGPSETGPMPPMEAALCSRPTITTRCGLMSDTFNEDEAIFHDATVEGLVAALRKFIDSRELCREMGLKARQRILTDRSWNELIKFQDEFFEQVYERCKQ